MEGKGVQGRERREGRARTGEKGEEEGKGEEGREGNVESGSQQLTGQMNMRIFLVFC